MSPNFGTGPGAITADGCAVEVYARLAPAGVPELIHEHTAAGASVLDLGAGVGRIADPLTDMGHRVVAVDDSRDMLARVRSATTVHCSIEHLRLPDRFDVALLVSFLVNTPDADRRRAFLATARHHLAPAGAVLMQWHPPEWFDALAAGGSYSGGARYLPGRPYAHEEGQLAATLEVESITDGVLSAVVTYDLDDQHWTHGWQTRRLTVEDLDTDLQASGLQFDRFLTQDRTWVRAAMAAREPA
ncbi:MAG: methyltransferase domain-containing protein [Propionibacteriales bacterium]|nr:methyltransferase domain-containing protein [Propionibacteriales bacterium]